MTIEKQIIIKGDQDIAMLKVILAAAHNIDLDMLNHYRAEIAEFLQSIQ